MTSFFHWATFIPELQLRNLALFHIIVFLFDTLHSFEPEAEDYLNPFLVKPPA